MNQETLRKFSCGQYNEILRRSGMLNQSPPCNYPKRSKRRRSNEFLLSGQVIHKPKPKLKFIADDNGCLLPELREKVKKKCNHWGPPGLSVWDDILSPCQMKPVCLRPYPDMGFEELPSYYKGKGRHKSIDCSQYDTCNNICSIYNLCNVAEEFENLQKLRLPVIWIYGYQQKGICLARKHFLYKLFKELGFTYIDMDQIMFDWGRNYIHAPPAPKLISGVRTNTCQIAAQAGTTKYGQWVGDEDDEIREEFEQTLDEGKGSCPGYSNVDAEIIKRKRDALKKASKHVQRCITLMYRLMADYQEACTPHGLCEFLKCALLQGYPTKGYVIEGYPINLQEAEVFEKTFWPVAGGIYFLNKSCTYHKHAKPEVEEPLLFRRSGIYNEKEVELTAKTYAFKSIKICHYPCVKRSDLDSLSDSIQSMLKQYPSILNGTADWNNPSFLAEFLPEDLREELPQPCVIPYSSEHEITSDEEMKEELDDKEGDEKQKSSELLTDPAESKIKKGSISSDKSAKGSISSYKSGKGSISSDKSKNGSVSSDKNRKLSNSLDEKPTLEIVFGMEIDPSKRKKESISSSESSRSTSSKENENEENHERIPFNRKNPMKVYAAPTDADMLDSTGPTLPPAESNIMASTRSKLPTLESNIMASTKSTLPPLESNMLASTKSTLPALESNMLASTRSTIQPSKSNQESNMLASTRSTIPASKSNMLGSTISTLPQSKSNQQATLSVPVDGTESHEIRSILRKGLGIEMQESNIAQFPHKFVPKSKNDPLLKKNSDVPPPAPPPTARSSSTSKATFVGKILVNKTSFP